MRTYTVKHTVYKFDELSEASKEKAKELIAQGNHELFDGKELTERFGEILKEWGFPHDESSIEWSLSYSQGDGVAFYGGIDIHQYLKKTRQLTKYRPLTQSRATYMDATTVRNSWGYHYSHYNTMSVGLDVGHDTGFSPLQESLIPQLQSSLEDDVVTVSRELERLGYSELEHVTTEEYIKDQIEANEWEFTEDGKIA